MKFSISSLASILVSSLATTSASDSEPPFFSRVIDSRFDKGTYPIVSSDLTNSGVPDIVTGSTEGAIRWYKRTTLTSRYPDAASYDSFLIGNLTGSIYIHAFDVNGDGYQDIISAHAFGGCPERCNPDTDGQLSWLENPKGKFGVPWKVHYMGKPTSPGHRLIGITSHLQSRKQRWVMSVPTVGFYAPGMKDPITESKMSISAYLVPDNTPADGQWNVQETIVDDTLHACHEGKAITWNNQTALLVGCSEGAFVYTPIEKSDSTVYWKKESILPALKYPNQTYTGVTAVAQTSAGGFAYLGPFHGNTVGYVLNGTTRTLAVLDKFKGGHDIEAAYFHGRTKSEKIVATMRTDSSGLYMFSFQGPNPLTSRFDLVKFYNGPVCTTTIADFNGDGYPDLASLNYGGMNDSSVVIHYSNPNYSV